MSYPQGFDPGASAEETVRWAVKEFGSGLVIASSFGAEDSVVMDMALKVSKNVRIITLDTGRLPEATYEVMDAFRRHYGVEVESYFPDAARVEALVRRKGFFSFRESVENRKECCQIRKVEPLGRALKGAKAWMTGLRKEQSMTRQDLAKVEQDAAHGSIRKINPLADWSWDQVKAYLSQNRVPYNRLHDEGFPSVGCAPCTRAVKPGEDLRAGRWWWETPANKECGIHVNPKTGKVSRS